VTGAARGVRRGGAARLGGRAVRRMGCEGEQEESDHGDWRGEGGEAGRARGGEGLANVSRRERNL